VPPIPITISSFSIVFPLVAVQLLLLRLTTCSDYPMFLDRRRYTTDYWVVLPLITDHKERSSLSSQTLCLVSAYTLTHAPADQTGRHSREVRYDSKFPEFYCAAARPGTVQTYSFPLVCAVREADHISEFVLESSHRLSPAWPLHNCFALRTRGDANANKRLRPKRNKASLLQAIFHSS